jgi:hypothetical protein
VVFANDFTAAPYTAICDGEVREAALIELILAGETGDGSREDASPATAKGRIEEARREILAEVIAGVRASASPVPLEALADRALRALGHERTIATGWAGAGSFRELLRRSLPDEIKLTGDAPYLAFDPKRHQQEEKPSRKAAETGKAPAEPSVTPLQPVSQLPQESASEEASAQAGADAATGARPVAQSGAAHVRPASVRADAPSAAQAARASAVSQAPAVQPTVAAGAQRLDSPNPIQQSIARIQEACQAPPLAPQEYRVLFEIMATEINEHDLLGVETLDKITRQVQERGINLRRDDVRFVLEVVSEADPWFEQGASADLFAGRFRTFVVARCRGQGLNLSAEELHLIDAWFLGMGAGQRDRGGLRATPAIAGPQGSSIGEAPQAEPLEEVSPRLLMRTRLHG